MRKIVESPSREQKLLRIEDKWDLSAGAYAAEESETLELIGGLLDSLTADVTNLNEELSSSLERMPGKHKDGVGH
jgi:hypothetical protein